MNDSLTFARPEWLWLLLGLVPLLLLRLRALQLRRRAVSSLVAPRLRESLVRGTSSGAGAGWRGWMRYFLQLLALACLVLAAARPQYGSIRQKVESRGRNILIAMDTSRSMLADDVKPDRLTRAKLAAQDLIEALPSDRIGLIAYAGTCFLQAPLTIDHEAVVEAIQQIDTEIIPRGGTNLSRAIELAADTFLKTKRKNNALIIFGDGEDLEGEETREAALEKAEAAGMTIVTVGVGTRRGAIIVDPRSQNTGDYIRDSAGEIVRTRLDDTVLRKLSQSAGGLYLNLDSANTMRNVVSRAIDRIDLEAVSAADREQPIERYRWPLISAIVLLVISLLPIPSTAPATSPVPRSPSRGRSAAGTAIIALLGVLHFLPQAVAFTPADDGGQEAFAAGRYEEALEKYEEAIERFSDPSEGPSGLGEKGLRLLAGNAPQRALERLVFGHGAAAYKLGDYEKAAHSFSEALKSPDRAIQTDAHYNLGNTLFQNGQAQLQEAPESTVQYWRDAVAHYESTLALDSDNESAKTNLEIVKKLLEQLQEQQQQQQEEQQEQDGEQGDQDQEQQDQEEQDQQEGEQKDGEQEGEGSSNSQQGQDGEPNDEEQEGDAPDEPGQEESEEGDGAEDQQPKEMLEGEISANDSSTPSEAEAQPAEEQPHPETGYTPSEARVILRKYSGEDLEVRPLLPRNYEPVIKNW